MNPKKLSRRDAIKLLGAVTGATVLANLPSKWSTPQIARGVLPAHAQTSGVMLSILACPLQANLLGDGSWSSTVNVGPTPIVGVVLMQYTIIFINTFFQPGPTVSPHIGTAPLASDGHITIDNNRTEVNDTAFALVGTSGGSGSFAVSWSFVDSSQGTGNCGSSSAFAD